MDLEGGGVYKKGFTFFRSMISCVRATLKLNCNDRITLALGYTSLGTLPNAPLHLRSGEFALSVGKWPRTKSFDKSAKCELRLSPANLMADVNKRGSGFAQYIHAFLTICTRIRGNICQAV